MRRAGFTSPPLLFKGLTAIGFHGYAKNMKTPYNVTVTINDPSKKVPYLIQRTFEDPRKALSAIYYVLNNPSPMEYYVFDDFTIEEHSKRPFVSLFKEKWKIRMWSSIGLRMVFPIGVIAAIITAVLGIVFTYAGTVFTISFMNFGFIASALLIVGGLIPLTYKVLRDVHSYQGVKDYLED